MSSFDNEINNKAFWYDKIQHYASEEYANHLTKERYEAELEYRENIAALDTFYADPENYLAPEYGKLLKDKIRQFEDARDNMTEPDDYQDEDYEESYEDMAERYRLERFENAIENARDDMRDDY